MFFTVIIKCIVHTIQQCTYTNYKQGPTYANIAQPPA